MLIALAAIVTRITYSPAPPPHTLSQLLIFHRPRCLALPVLGATSAMALEPQSAKPASPAKLDYRTLGRTGLKVTTVGMGCMITSDPSVITRAADLGINYFDTARGYQHGNNERLVAAGLGAKRKQVILSTKSHAANKEELQQHLETSLRELNTDYIDIWYLHAHPRFPTR